MSVTAAKQCATCSGAFHKLPLYLTVTFERFVVAVNYSNTITAIKLAVIKLIRAQKTHTRVEFQDDDEKPHNNIYQCEVIMHTAVKKQLGFRVSGDKRSDMHLNK